jgi:hypothetical protein
MQWLAVYLEGLRMLVKYYYEGKQMKLKLMMLLAGSVLSLTACIEVRDKDEENKSQSMTPLVEDKGLVIDQEMYIYDGKILNADDLDKEIKLNEFQKKLVSNDVELSYQELTFTENGKLYTLGQNVRLHIGNLNTSNGQIVTFPENETAKAGQNGRSGGHLLLDLKSAKGALKIQMRGENGGRGPDAPPPDENLMGKRGRDISSEIFNGRCAKGPISEDCGQGGKGLKGYPGAPGGSGGNTGSLEVRLNDNSDFTQFIDRIPGHGAHGGSGGLGGIGGPHGIIDVSSFGLKMEWYQAEGFNYIQRYGPAGDLGDPGPYGRDGMIENICIDKNGATLCY